MHVSRRGFVLLGAGAAVARAQMLSRPGWRGTGLAPEAWWKHAAFVRFPAGATFADATAALPWMSEVSADSILLPDSEPVAGSPLPFTERAGTEEQLDELLSEAGRRRMHVLLAAPLRRLSGSEGEVRFWMNRGVAGFDVGTVSMADGDSLLSLRSLLDRFSGQRILMGRTSADGVSAAAPRGRRVSRDPLTLHEVSAADAEAGLVQPSGVAQVVEVTLAPPAADSAANSGGGAKAAGSPAWQNFTAEAGATGSLPSSMPALRSLLPLLLASGAPVFDSRLLATATDRAAVATVLSLRNTHAALRSGRTVALASDAAGLRAWLLPGRDRGGAGSLVLAVNNGSVPLKLQLQAAVQRAGVRGFYLRPLLRSDGGMGAVDLDSGVLPAGGALLAEVGR